MNGQFCSRMASISLGRPPARARSAKSPFVARRLWALPPSRKFEILRAHLKKRVTTMVTFIHLSDIHFSQRDNSSQYDLDQQIRRAILEDLERRPGGDHGYKGVLVTGDIAFGGEKEEYKTAQTWLDEVFRATGTTADTAYVVPGNHDVDRRFVQPEFPLWDSHARIRKEPSASVWNDVIAKQLQKDPLHSLLAPLEQYNNFAQGYDCRTLPDELAWTHVLKTPMSDGTRIRLHGLNSALISDGDDAPGRMLVSQFQTSRFCRTAGIVDVVMCHHPPDWLMDKTAVREALRAFAPVALFGHEHDARIVADKKQVQLFAGAVQPSRRDPGWLPTYHVLQLEVENHNSERVLAVRIHTREFRRDFRFYARHNEDDVPVDEHFIPLPPMASPGSVVGPSSGPPMTTPQPHSEEHVEGARRQLLVHFFRLGTPLRFAAAGEAGLVRDGDDSLHPQVMWAQVFRRAEEEQRLGRFWTAVARHSPALSELRNPFDI